MTDVRMIARWRAWHREQLDDALAGPHGDVVRPIIALLADLTPQKMLALIELLRAQDWRLVDANARFIILHEINSAVTQLRERKNRPPFDDTLPDEQPTLFLIARELLSCTSRKNPAGEIPATQRSRLP